jgi:hypothetical protein
MKKFSGRELYEIYKALRGHTDFACESNYDEQSYKNFREEAEFIELVISELLENYQSSFGRNEYSVSRLHELYKSTLVRLETMIEGLRDE